jgi:hypothetical protein
MEATPTKRGLMSLILWILFWIYWIGTLSSPFGFYWACMTLDRTLLQTGLLFIEVFAAIGLCFSSAILVRTDPKLAQLGLITMGIVLIILLVMIASGLTMIPEEIVT